MTNSLFKSGSYVRLEIDEYGNLMIIPGEDLTTTDAQAIRELFEDEGESEALRTIFCDLTEQEDLEWLEPAEIAALTDAPILAEYVERDDNGTIGGLGRLWWHERYQVESAVEELLAGRPVRFQAALDDGVVLEGVR